MSSLKYFKLFLVLFFVRVASSSQRTTGNIYNSRDLDVSVLNGLTLDDLSRQNSIVSSLTLTSELECLGACNQEYTCTYTIYVTSGNTCFLVSSNDVTIPENADVQVKKKEV